MNYSWGIISRNHSGRKSHRFTGLRRPFPPLTSAFPRAIGADRWQWISSCFTLISRLSIWPEIWPFRSLINAPIHCHQQFNDRSNHQHFIWKFIRCSMVSIQSYSSRLINESHRWNRPRLGSAPSVIQLSVSISAQFGHFSVIFPSVSIHFPLNHHPLDSLMPDSLCLARNCPDGRL